MIPDGWSGLDGYLFEERRHAGAIVAADYPEVVDEIRLVLEPFRIRRNEVLAGGGGKSPMTQALEKGLAELAWTKRRFDVRLLVGGGERESQTHEIDHVRVFDDGRRAVALEIEWNNKDPFYDRDLDNFKRLHALGVISLGIIVTRGPTLKAALRETFVRHYEGLDADVIREEIARTRNQQVRSRLETLELDPARERLAAMTFQSKYGEATTQWTKLMARIERDQGDPCPLLLIGIDSQRLVD